MNTSSNDRLRQILEFWHKVEFFIPYDLRGQVLQADDAESRVKRITVAELQALSPDATGDLWQVARVPEGMEVSGFNLFLGVFDKGALATVTGKAVDESSSEEIEIDQEERGDLEGETCFAKVRLNALGEPQFDQVSVSTVPWALGRVLHGGVESLSFEAFQSSLRQLQEDLLNFQARRSAAAGVAEHPQEHLPLTRADIEKLLAIFYAWAEFEPDKSESTLAVVRAVVRKKSTASEKRDDKPAPKPEADAEPPESDDDDESETDSSAEAEIDILNSFYIKDIERAILSISQGQTIAALDAYLTPLHKQDRVDLYSAPGRQRIISDLHPANTPPAHWLDEPDHAMSLMQQFAINHVFTGLSENGLFSVNGPPGTGKTTLLRDIFAENMTRRARVLASLDSAKDAFQAGQKPKLEFEGKLNSWTIALLKPELTGFEMIVASSNNAAVNNISEDLPKAKSLGSIEWSEPVEIAWRRKDGSPKQSYLQPVAIRMAEQTSRGDFVHLEPDDTPWGLISCALGKRDNRYKFVERFSRSVLEKDSPKEASKPKGYDPDRHQSFWDWRDQYQGKGLSFLDAKAAFVALDKEVRDRQEQLVKMVRIVCELAGHTEGTYTSAEAQALSDAKAIVNQEQIKLENIDEALNACLETLATLKEDEKLIPVPSLWTRLLGKIFATRFWNSTAREKCRKYQDDLGQNRTAQRKCLQEKLSLRPQRVTALLSVDRAKDVAEAAERHLQTKIAEWRTKDAERKDLRSCFSQAAIPESTEALEEAQWQKEGIWRDSELNALRSKLFAAALSLHEAWLAEVTVKGGGFSPNIYAICDLIRGQRLTTPEHALALWQSLFMVVPVVSSTFASIASQFKDIGANTLGWLFIDEAGQAVPQAAVGALWRAKRAVVVGDPMQIEPIFTVPIKLIEALAKSSHLPEDINVAPHKVSVQNLADAANACGTSIPVPGDEPQCEPQWIGSPLRVHRRCVEPMFRIANAIAYGGKMVFGLNSATPAADGYDLGASAWVDVPGATEGRHVVPAQIELVTQAVMSLYQSKGKLPPLYIISPFKRIKRALVESLSDMKAWKERGITTLSKGALAKWCQASIGTVHTFQGKEELIVWMVLGCDGRSAGAVSWAASKPNILNVALTRAKRRFFMIGDVALWGDKPYFDTAKRNLPEITQTEFLGRMRQQTVAKPDI